MGRLRANCARLDNPMQDFHLRKEPDVTGLPLVSPMLRDVEQKPPSLGRSPAEDF